MFVLRAYQSKSRLGENCSEKTPPPHGGVTHLQALPDSVLEYETSSASGELYRTEGTPHCDDCVADEKAV